MPWLVRVEVGDCDTIVLLITYRIAFTSVSFESQDGGDGGDRDGCATGDIQVS